MAKALAIYHVVDHFISGRHWIVLATSKKEARRKVVERVPDLDIYVLADTKERLDVNRAADTDMTEVTAEINTIW